MQNTRAFEADHFRSVTSDAAEDRSGGISIVAHVDDQTAAGEEKNEISQLVILHIQKIPGYPSHCIAPETCPTYQPILKC